MRSKSGVDAAHPETPNGLPDDVLVQLANEGDISAFEALYQRYLPWMLRQALKVTRNVHLAEECAQQVALYWMGKFPGFRLDAKVTTFLHPVVRNTALELLRKERRACPQAGSPEAERVRQHMSEMDGGGTKGSLPEAAEVAADRSALRAALARLRPDGFQLLRLVFWEGMTVERAAKALSLPFGTAKGRMRGALCRLRVDPALRDVMREGLDNSEKIQR